MLMRPRSSKIFYRGNFYAYPLKPLEALSQLGVLESTLCVFSFLQARLRPVPKPQSFEDWVVNEFGERLFRTFFKTYTEKVWGMSCKEISADWAAQRIKGLTLGGAIKNALLPKRKFKDGTGVVKTLIDTFRYPRFGPGMMWEACAERVRALGGEVLLGRSVVACRFDAGSSDWSVTARTPRELSRNFAASISSLRCRCGNWLRRLSRGFRKTHYGRPIHSVTGISLLSG